ncbi:gliding motility-associated C-terminal domain-containing protein [Mucilaginibacter ximonensis]|uniref:Gliding motility-associated C-terminal domain-containing protein n=1 Tax=Mucilaginibacter ximonensis TaxID=538021 RepID=A0ABW5YEM1_9SPHI
MSAFLQRVVVAVLFVLCFGTTKAQLPVQHANKRYTSAYLANVKPGKTLRLSVNGGVKTAEAPGSNSPVTPVVKMVLVSGKIVACMGVPSAAPNVLQYTVTGSNLTSDVVLQTLSPNIEISTVSSTSGYINRIFVPQMGGKVSFVVYVRSSASAIAPTLSADIRITSGTEIDQNQHITGTIYTQSSVNNPGPQTATVNTVKDIVFTGAASSYSWTNDNTNIGLASYGTGNIHFTAVNNGDTNLKANIVVTPSNANGCTGIPEHFTITVPTVGPATINVSGKVAQLNTVYGTPSTSGIFIVSGDNLKAGLTVTPPPGFEVSDDGITFRKTLTTVPADAVPPTNIYIRLAKTTPAGIHSGTVVISSAGAADANIILDDNNFVKQAPLTITADNKSKYTGDPNPALTVTYTGFVNAETASALATPPTLVTTALPGSPPGMYPITVSGATAANYTITFVPGTLTVKPQPANIVLSNSFSPNGDGINDTWIIKNIEGFPNCVVQVFSRYGSSVFYSVNYPTPWDGRLKGVDLPVGTYYYIIDLKNGSRPATGWLAIIR